MWTEKYVDGKCERKHWLSEILSSHGGENVDCDLIGCNIMWSCR
jgi:hypothetical protein